MSRQELEAALLSVLALGSMSTGALAGYVGASESDTRHALVRLEMRGAVAVSASPGGCRWGL